MEKAYEIIKIGQQQPALMTRPPLPGVGPEFMPVPPSPAPPEFMPVPPSPAPPFTATGSQFPSRHRPPSMPT